MYYAWIEDLYEVSGIDFDIYNVFIYSGLSGQNISYSGYYKDYTLFRWNL